MSQTLNVFRKLSSSSSLNSSTQNAIFKNIAPTWWQNCNNDPLYLMNKVRVPFIREALNNSELRNNYKIDKTEPLKGFNLLDIGCGVGFLSESLARLGATITGIDPEPENVKQANIHKEIDAKIQHSIEYVCGVSNELLPKLSEKFDAVIASEVIEHVDNQEDFVETAVDLTKKNGSLFFTTINKTNLSYITTIVFAEKVLGIVPSGMHDWNKFVTPEELTKWLEFRGCEVRSIHGMKYNPFTKTFNWCKDTSDNYALHAIKR